MKMLLGAFLVLATLSSQAAEVERRAMSGEACFNSYRNQAQKDMQTVADDRDIVKYEGTTTEYRWSSSHGYSVTQTDHFSLQRGQKGAITGFGVLLAAGLAGAPIPIMLPFTLGIFGGAAVQVALETRNAARRLKTYAVVSQARACAVEENCNFENGTEMYKLHDKAAKKGFQGDLKALALKINDSMGELCEQKIRTKKNGKVKSKDIRTYGYSHLLDAAEAI